jgi:hypothetical protein
MSVSGSWRNPIFINTIGHSAGVLLFGLIIGLLMRDWRSHGRRRAKLSLMAASLALGWNVGSLVVLASNVPASSAWIEFVATASFSMLSLLPAVLLQVAVQGQHRAVVAAGYLVSACAIVLHFCEPFLGAAGLHQAGLVSIVFGFGVLTITAALRALNHPRPRVINVDGNPAYPSAIEELKRTRELGRRCRCRPVRYLNNLVEQDHRAIKRRVRAMQGFRAFHSAWRTIQGVETVNMIRKGQIRWLPKDDILGQAAFIVGLFGVALTA